MKNILQKTNAYVKEPTTHVTNRINVIPDSPRKHNNKLTEQHEVIKI